MNFKYENHSQGVTYKTLFLVMDSMPSSGERISAGYTGLSEMYMYPFIPSLYDVISY